MSVTPQTTVGAGHLPASRHRVRPPVPGAAGALVAKQSLGVGRDENVKAARIRRRIEWLPDPGEENHTHRDTLGQSVDRDQGCRHWPRVGHAKAHATLAVLGPHFHDELASAMPELLELFALWHPI